MTMHRIKILAGVSTLAFLALSGAASAAVATGSANFTTYVALGDSLTAGFSSGSINQTYQVNSYPALIYRQAKGVTTNAGFEQPLVSPPGLPGILVLRSLLPVTITPSPTTGAPINLTLPRPYNNLAVPGATLHDLLTKTASTSANDPTDLILRHLGGGTTQLQQGLSLKPTFVSLWIGNNDALAAATSGIVIEGVTITPVAQFTADYNTVVKAITAAGAKLVLSNIPDVTSIPFVTTVPRVVVNPATQQPVLGPNGQPIPLIGPNGPLQAGDFVLLTATSLLAQGIGVPSIVPGGTGQPLPDTAVLSAAEVAVIKTHVDAYNAVIAAAAATNGAALVNANATLKDLAANGLEVGGISYSSKFLTGGVFGYDGVHPTAFGYAYIANQFIASINTSYGASIPPVNLYPYVFGPLPKHKAVADSTSVVASDSRFTDIVFTEQARVALLKSLNVPQAVIDGTYRKPRPRPHH
jgi:phospholipase/lecithinase/hemolysin